MGDDTWHAAAPVAATLINSTFMDCHFSCNKVNQSFTVPPIWDNHNMPVLFLNTSSNQLCPHSCSLGEYSRMHLITCRSCNAGSYSNSTLATECTPCVKGHSTNGQKSSTKCFPCDPGYVATYDGSARCTPCSRGYYAPHNGSISCAACPTNTYQPNLGRSYCLSCSFGYISTPSSAECHMCGEDTYTINSECRPCPFWWSSKPGSDSCSEPSWRMGAVIGGVAVIIVVSLGVCILKRQKHRAGYIAVQSVVSPKISKKRNEFDIVEE